GEATRDFVVFASDINDTALDKARKGVYGAGVAEDIPESYLRKYTERIGDDAVFVMDPELRSRILFAKHSMLGDPPFSKQDLVICRNLLIYLDPKIQARCIDTFHYALHENHYLFLGKAETVSGKHSLFKALEPKEARIYRRLPGPSPTRFSSAIRPSTSTIGWREQPRPEQVQAPVIDAARAMLLGTYAPAAVAIDKHYTILFNSGPVNRYLVPPPGEPTTDLLEQLPSRLGSRIRGAVLRAAQNDEVVVLRAAMPGEGGGARLTITVSRIEERDDYFLVVFEEKKSRARAEAKQTADEPSASRAEVQQLEDELTATRLDLQQHVEQLKSINEELQSSNEELSVSNEELETSREELQSLNEELITVNGQLQAKMGELERTNNDLVNFQVSTDIPVLFLDHELRVRRFTPAMTRLMGLIGGDIGRALADLAHENLGPGLVEDVERVLNELEPLDREIAVDGAWYMRRIRPYRTADERIEGVVVSFADVSRLKVADEEARAAAEKFRIVADFTYDWEYWRGSDSRFVYMTPSCERVTGYSRDEFMADPGLYTRIMHPDDRERMTTHLCEDLEHQKHERLEFRITRRDGQVRWMDHVCQPVLDEQGRIIGRRAANRDITERKRTDEALLRSREDLSRAQEVAHLGSWRLDVRRNELTWSDENHRIFGIPQGTPLSYETFLDTVHPDDRALVDASWQAGLRGEPYDIEHRIVVNGTTKWVREKAYLETADDGTLLGGFGITLDITERREAEEALRSERELLQTIFDSIPVMLSIYEPSLDILRLNRAVYETTGWSEADVAEKGIMELVYPDRRYREEIAAYMQSLQPGFRDLVMTCKDGATRETSWANIRMPDGRQVGIGIDISERKRAEQEREQLLTQNRTEREFLETLIANVPVGIAVVRGRDYRYELVNDYYRNIPTGSDGPIEGKTVMEVLPAIAAQGSIAALDRVRRTGETAGLEEYRADIEGRGETYWNVDHIPIRNAAGDIDRVLILAVDVTGLVVARMESEASRNIAERRATEAEEGERILEALLAHVPEGIIITEGVDKPITVSKMLSVWTGGRMHNNIRFGSDAFVEAWGLVHPETEAPIEKDQLPISRVLNEGTLVVDDVWLQKGPDGTRRYLSANAGPILDRHGDVVGCVVAWRDVTDRRNLEDELQRRADELAAANTELESFSYSVSHDLRNPLNNIGMLVRVLAKRTSGYLDAEGQRSIDYLDANVARMSNIISDLLLLSRLSRQELEVEQTDLGALAREFVDELRRTNPDRRIEVLIQENLTAGADSKLMKIAVENLIRNAWKYTSKCEQARIEIGAEERGGRTVYYVQDNGVGFDMQDAERIFSPFQRAHSEKEYKGSGIGLSIVKRIVQKHGGEIWAESEQGDGARFSFTLP
ncbi:MAG: PAS domain S-box protein, partial [Chitinivibrionales bacterium]|nr:PAS domain S-box protein [Chitinivibrionales bacterium]